jgi:hypothetical protein
MNSPIRVLSHGYECTAALLFECQPFELGGCRSARAPQVFLSVNDCRVRLLTPRGIPEGYLGASPTRQIDVSIDNSNLAN